MKNIQTTNLIAMIIGVLSILFGIYSAISGEDFMDYFGIFQEYLKVVYIY